LSRNKNTKLDGETDIDYAHRRGVAEWGKWRQSYNSNYWSTGKSSYNSNCCN